MATMGNKYPKEVIDYIIEAYPTTRTAEMAEVLGISMNKVHQLANSRGIKKTKEYIRKVHGPVVALAGINNRFYKGQEAWNKGIKGRNNAPEHTLFKPGHLPANHKPIGWTRVDGEGYTWMKIAEGRQGWVMIHRLAWELENGPIPEGKFLRFIDGNKDNWQVENLMLVDRESNMRLNTIHRYPEEVKSAMKILSKLKRKIESHGKEQD
jgi:hypothetical protein